MCCVPRPGGRVPAVASHPQAPAASAPRTHTVGPPAPERPGAAAAGGSTATPAVPGKTQATVPAAAASHQQGTALCLSLAPLITMATSRMCLPYMVRPEALCLCVCGTAFIMSRPRLNLWIESQLNRV